MDEHDICLPQAVWARYGLPPQVRCSRHSPCSLDDLCDRLPEVSAYVRAPDRTVPRSTLIFADGYRVINIDDTALPSASELTIVIASAGG